MIVGYQMSGIEAGTARGLGLWILLAARPGERSAVNVRLDFGDAGPLNVHITMRDGRVHTMFRCDSPELRDTLARHFTLARPELDNEQRLRVQGMRAAVRSTTAANLVGAISDYDQMIRIAPAGHRLAKVAVDEKAYSETQKGYIDRRIAAGPAPNPVQYFNDLMQLGRHADAASFAKASMIDLTSLQAEKLAKAGFLCEGPGYGGRAYRWGGSGAAHTVYWCDAG